MVTFTDVSDILDDIYGAALGEKNWETALERLTDTLGYSVATIEFHSVDERRLLSIETARIDPDDLEVYASQFVDKNPRLGFTRRNGCKVLFDQLYLSEKDMDRNVFYADFLEPRNLRYYLSSETLLEKGTAKGVISMQRPGGVAGADEEGIKLMSAFQPHLDRALGIYWNRLRGSIDPDFMDRELARFGLTGAERRLARAIILGEKLKDYAGRNELSMNTVYTHYRHVKEKLDCVDQGALVLRLNGIARGGG